MNTTKRSERRPSALLMSVMVLLGCVLWQSSAVSVQGQWTTNGNNINSTNTGNVGIGTSTPNNKLHVVGKVELGATSGTGVNPTLVNPNTLANFSQVQFYPASGTNVNMSFAVVPKGTGVANNRAQFTIFNTDYIANSTNYEFAALRARGNDIVFGTGKAGSGVNRPLILSAGYLTDNVTNANQLYLNTNGNVGIGTATPASRLDVHGDANVTGNINVTGNVNAKYQDIAEWVESSQALPAGTVVVLDSTRSNHVIASSRAYDTRVAGVISAMPGIALGERGDNKVLVATTGRVRLKVDASHDPIQVGDLLVTSDLPGVAMKSEAINIGGVQIHRPGTLIGKALEPLAKGRGEILVLLSLQ